MPAGSRIQTIIDRQESTHGRWQLFVAVIAIALGGVYAWRSSRDFADDLGILTGVYSAIVLLVRGLWSLLRFEQAPTITVSQIDSLSLAMERQWRPEIVKRSLAAVDREVMRRNGWRYEFRHRTLLERLGDDSPTAASQ
ncbi:MAG TPA: hypothetical protein VLL08_19805 [Kineosporiaceae bacterium]|nr:hypothetical protein [Kineosporiaceae bacterium]